MTKCKCFVKATTNWASLGKHITDTNTSIYTFIYIFGLPIHHWLSVIITMRMVNQLGILLVRIHRHNIGSGLHFSQHEATVLLSWGMDVCVCVYACVCVCVCVFMHVCVCICMWVCFCVCACSVKCCLLSAVPPFLGQRCKHKTVAMETPMSVSDTGQSLHWKMGQF